MPACVIEFSQDTIDALCAKALEGITLEGTETITLTIPGAGTVDICPNPVKAVAVGGDLEIDNSDPANPVISYTGAPADGSSAFGMVAADGTIMLPDGSTAAAVTGSGDPIDPDTAVLNVFDGDGNYLGSKICDVTAGVQSVSDGGSSIVDNSNPQAPIFRPLMGCGGDPVNVTTDEFLTRNQGHAPVVASSIAGITADPECKPPAPDCDIPGMLQKTQNQYGTVDWMWTGDDWICCGFSAKRFSQKAQVLNPLLSDDQLGGGAPVTPVVITGETAIPDVTLGNTWSTIARTCLVIENDDCVPWAVRYDVRGVFSGSMTGGNYWLGRIIGSELFPTGLLNGTAQHRNDDRCRGLDNCMRFFDDVIEAQSPVVYTVDPGQELRACIDMQYRITAFESNTNNEFGENAFALIGEITRDCGE